MENTLSQNEAATSRHQAAGDVVVRRNKIRPLQIAKTIAGIAIAFVTLFPIYWLFLISFRDSNAIKRQPHLRLLIFRGSTYPKDTISLV